MTAPPLPLPRVWRDYFLSLLAHIHWRQGTDEWVALYLILFLESLPVADA